MFLIRKRSQKIVILKSVLTIVCNNLVDSADQDQTTDSVQSDLDLHCLQKLLCSNNVRAKILDWQSPNPQHVKHCFVDTLHQSPLANKSFAEKQDNINTASLHHMYPNSLFKQQQNLMS